MKLTINEQRVIEFIREAGVFADIVVEKRPTKEFPEGEIFAVDVKKRSILGFTKQQLYQKHK